MKAKARVDSYQAFMKEPRNAAVVHDFIDKLKRDKERDGAIVTAIERNGEAPSAAHMEQLRRYAQARARYIKEVPLLRSSEVAELSGSTARNGSARASRWKKERRVFAVPWNGVDYYPAFQFSPTDGEPLPAIQTIIEIFGDGMTPWQTALWFWGGNAWTPGERPPMDVIATDPEIVIEAAKREMEPIFG